MNVRLLALAAAGLLLAGCAATDTEDPAETPIAPMLTEMQEEVEATTDSDPGYATPEEMEEAEEPAEDEGPEPTAAVASEPAPESDVTPTTEPGVEETPGPAASETAEPEPTGYTMQMISANNTASKCWVAIDGMAYDLTGWISSHPGGSSAIANLCGKDGTSRFSSQHGGQANPDRTLDGYLLGPING